MLKNVAGQAIGAQLIVAQTGAAATGGPITVFVTGDNGVQTQGTVASGLCTHEGNGYWSYNPSQAETNFNTIGFTFTGPGAIPTSVTVATVTEAQAAALATSTIVAVGDGPTRTELLAQIAYRLNKTPPPNMDSATEARLASYLNQRQRRLLSQPGISRLRDGVAFFTSTPDLPYAWLPNIAKVKRIFETVNQRVLYEMSQQDYREMGPLPMAGTPEAYVWTGHKVVSQQPPSLSQLLVWSTHPADITPLVYLEGVVQDGYPQSVSVVLNGTTPVDVAAPTVNWRRVDKFYLSTPCRGNIFLAAVDSLGVQTLLSYIATGTISTVYTGLTLFPTPTAAIDYQVDIVKPVTDLIHGTDQTPLPIDFSDLLVLGALADEYQHLQDPRWATAMREYTERENELKYWLAETATGRPFGLARTWQRPSQLGSWFAGGT